MGKVAAFELVGIECWFFSQDHRPPHFHARKPGRWHVRVYFLAPPAAMIERVRGPRARFPTRDARALCEAAEAHRAKLLVEWEAKVACDD
jgi:hypothetical protein